MVHELQRDGAADAASSTISHTVAVDLGCGTGLAGAAMKPFCKGTLLGCDLSGGMIRLAKKKRGPDEKRIYDKLETVDAVAFLHRSLEPASADLIVAADVTVYMRSLEGLMQGAARCRNQGQGQGPYGRGQSRPSARVAEARGNLKHALAQRSLRSTSWAEG